MKAVCWYGKHDIRVEEVPDPHLINPRDAIIKVSSTAICGSDLHIYDGYVVTMQKGDILGHEFMGQVVEVGPEVKNLKVGDRVVVPFTISCGQCYYCQQGLWSLCDNSNPNAWMAEQVFGYTPAGLFGYSHLMGGYAGGQAEYVRVPFADVGPFIVPDHLSDDQVLLLSDNLPTAYMAAENANIRPGHAVAIWGCGPIGLLTIQMARVMGAARIIAIDQVPARLRLAQQLGAETINFSESSVVEDLKAMTGGRGPDACIDAVGMEAGGRTIDALYDRVMQSVRLETDRPYALREAIQACRKGGAVSIAGVYVGMIDKVPFGAAMNKGLTLRMGQAHVHKYMRPLLDHIERGQIDPTLIVTHHMALEDAVEGYELFKNKADGVIKVVLKPETARTLGEERGGVERAARVGSGRRELQPERVEDQQREQELVRAEQRRRYQAAWANTPNTQVTPSQAEGSRRAMDDDLRAKGLSDEDEPESYGRQIDDEPDEITLPEQAEGSRKQIEENLRAKGLEGGEEEQELEAGAGSTSGAQPTRDRPTPSQADVSREQIEEDLRSKGLAESGASQTGAEVTPRRRGVGIYDFRTGAGVEPMASPQETGQDLQTDEPGLSEEVGKGRKRPRQTPKKRDEEDES